ENDQGAQKIAAAEFEVEEERDHDGDHRFQPYRDDREIERATEGGVEIGIGQRPSIVLEPDPADDLAARRYFLVGEAQPCRLEQRRYRNRSENEESRRQQQPTAAP